MANPEHVPVLDSFDRMTVALYRSGLVAASACLLAVAVLYTLKSVGVWVPTWAGPLSLALTSLCVMVCAVNLHLYVKQVRWLMAGAAPLGLALQVVALAIAEVPGAHVLETAGLGFVFVTLSGIALKERFCFRIPGLPLVPVTLALGLIPLLVDWPPGVAACYGFAGLVVGWLSIAKWGQPLHFDVGDKAAYQV
jgi:uncharacterized integral membrane protein